MAGEEAGLLLKSGESWDWMLFENCDYSAGMVVDLVDVEYVAVSVAFLGLDSLVLPGGVADLCEGCEQRIVRVEPGWGLEASSPGSVAGW